MTLRELLSCMNPDVAQRIILTDSRYREKDLTIKINQDEIDRQWLLDDLVTLEKYLECSVKEWYISTICSGMKIFIETVF